MAWLTNRATAPPAAHANLAQASSDLINLMDRSPLFFKLERARSERAGPDLSGPRRADHFMMLSKQRFSAENAVVWIYGQARDTGE